MGPLITIIAIVVFILLCATVKIVKQYERKVTFTLGKYSYILNPGLNFVIPFIQTTTTVDVREKAVDVPSQEAMTKDNISCTINAVIYYKIRESDAYKAVINVKYLDYAMTQFAQTTMRNIIGQFELDELLAKREEASHKIKEIVDEKSDARGVEVMSVELKDINIPVDLQRTIGKQAEAEREKRAKIITSEGELASAENLQQAAEMLARTPGALHLRTLQSINDISSDQSNTTIWMVPVEILEAIKGVGDFLKK
ncbi:MAG: slipin family protein [Candidatus Peribacteria bacterium]|jgi:regulator of protease activity HflC (stomatin/prohibitin superfamily)|nr:slipin family protein [Candidatus Peribacteria bacterium]